VGLTTSPPSVSRLSRKNEGASISHNPMGLHGLLRDSFTLLECLPTAEGLLQQTLLYNINKIDKKLKRYVVPVLNKAPGNECVWGSRDTAPRTRSPYRREYCPRHPVDRRLGGPNSRSGCCGEEKNLVSLFGIKPRFLECPARSLVDGFNYLGYNQQ
jgi:hypothetical protein